MTRPWPTKPVELLDTLAQRADRAVVFVGDWVSGAGYYGEPGPSKTVARRQVVRADIRTLETELRRLHARIASGVQGEALDNPERWIRRARELRARLHELRLTLARIDRVSAREGRLSPGVASARPPRSRPSKKQPALAARRRRAVMRALAKNREGAPEEREILRRLAEALLRPEPDARRRAVTRLAGLGPTARPLLIASLTDPDETTRVRALLALLDTKRGAPFELLRRLAADPGPLVRAVALRAMVQVDRRRGFAPAVAALEDGAPDVRRAAADALGSCMSTRALMPLAFALVDEDRSVRAAAVVALGVLGDDRAVPPLLRTLTDPAPRVRSVTVESLRLLVGEAIEEAAEPLGAEGLVTGLTLWWRTARVDIGLDRRLRAGRSTPARPIRPISASALLDRAGAEPSHSFDPQPVVAEPASKRDAHDAAAATVETARAPREDAAPRREEASPPPSPISVRGEPAPPKVEEARVTAPQEEKSDSSSSFEEKPELTDGEFESVGGEDGESFESIGGGDEGEFESVGGESFESFESIGGGDEGEFETIGGGDEGESVGGGDEGEFETIGGDDEGEFETIGGDEGESVGGGDEGEFETIGGGDEGEFESIGGGDGDEGEFESIGGGDDEDDEEEYETLL